MVTKTTKLPPQCEKKAQVIDRILAGEKIEKPVPSKILKRSS